MIIAIVSMKLHEFESIVSIEEVIRGRLPKGLGLLQHLGQLSSSVDEHIGRAVGISHLDLCVLQKMSLSQAREMINKISENMNDIVESIINDKKIGLIVGC